MPVNDNTARVLSLLGRLYAATTNPCQWESFLQSLAECFGASGALLTNYDTAHEMATFAIVHELPATHLDDLVKRAGEDPRGPYNIGQPWHPGLNVDWHPDAPPDWPEKWDYASVSADRMFCTTEYLHSTAFYREVLAPLDIEYSAGLILRGDRYVTGCGLFRPASGDVFAPQELDLLRALAPHLSQAVEMHRNFATLRFESAAVAESLNRISIGVTILDVSGAVLYMNETALAICAESDEIGCRNNRLQFARPDDERAFADAIVSVLQTDAGHRTVRLGDSDASPRLSVLLSPARHEALTARSALCDNPRCVAFMIRPTAASDREMLELSEAYGLTPAEGRVLAGLLDGRDPGSIAEALGIAVSTVRTHIKRLYEKTGTSRQTELVVKALNSPAWVLNLAFGSSE